MRRHSSLLLMIAIVILGTTWALQLRSSRADDKTKAADKAAQDEKPGVRKAAVRAFMRKKLAATDRILEGLATENFDLIAEGAKQLKATAGAAEFMEYDDSDYVEHANDFRRIVNKLGVAAKERRLDGSTLAFLDVTLSCIECHKHVRGAAATE